MSDTRANFLIRYAHDFAPLHRRRVLPLSMVDNSNSSLNDLTAYSTRRILAS